MGGGTGGPGLEAGRWMTVNVQSNTEAATTTTYKGDITTSPVLFGEVVSFSTFTQTILELSGPSLQLSVCAKNTAADTYQIDPGLMCTGVQYIMIHNPTLPQHIYGAISGTVTLTSDGAVGEPITGSFDSIVSNNTDTKRVWGSFSIKRVM